MSSTPDDKLLTPWDSIPASVRRWHIGFVFQRSRAARMAARIEGIERLSQHSSVDDAALASDLFARRERWRSVLGLGPAPPAAATPAQPTAGASAQREGSEEESPVLGSLRGGPETFLSELVFGAVLAVPLVAILAGAFWSAGVFIFIVAVAAATRPGLRPRLRGALDGDQCPNCRYDLRGIGPPMQIEERLGVRTGPRRCPECGCAWPLVPAAIELA